MKYIRIIVRILLGSVFIFSGFVKGIDPMGAGIKFSEYFEAFHLLWLGQLALILAITLSTAELLIGICLVIGLRMKVTAWAAMIFMSFFTLLTLYSAIFNPVTDCGCFGDALVLTNWQTFYKNVFLIILAGFVFYSRHQYTSFYSKVAEWALVVLFAGTGAGISIYCYNHLPVLNFRPYSIGTYIPGKMIMPKGVPTDVYRTELYYKKNGVVKKFTMQNYPWRDSTWEWVRTKSVLIKKGYTPPIHGFTISTDSDQDITSQVLSDTSYSFIFTSYNLTFVKKYIWKRVKEYYDFALKHGHKFYFLTASTYTDAQRTQSENDLPFRFLYTDQTILKTIVRSDPGLFLLKDGVVLGSWHYHDFPRTDFFKGNILSNVLTSYNKSMEHKKILLFVLVFIVAVLLLTNLKTRLK